MPTFGGAGLADSAPNVGPANEQLSRQIRLSKAREPPLVVYFAGVLAAIALVSILCWLLRQGFVAKSWRVKVPARPGGMRETQGTGLLSNFAGHNAKHAL
jgi:hypothetical protein